MKRWLGITLAAGAVIVVAGGVAVFALTGPGPIPVATVDFDRLDDDSRAELVARGRYVARAADCAACHTSEDDLAYAGGLPMETPFGTIYGSNITPSADHGIGGWSADDLYRSLAYGIMPDGTRLYPAMPYTSYHAMTRADVDALWLYLMSRPAVEKPDRPAEMMFPFNIRPAIALWNMVFRPHDEDDPDGEDDVAPGTGNAAGAPQDWRRGRYLVEVLGHCGECHTPRTIAYAKDDDRHLKGEVIEGALAPDISADGLAARGWTRPDLEAFLSTGLAPQGTMTFRMYPVLNHSTRFLTDADIAAMAGYLIDDATGAGAEGGGPAAPTRDAGPPPDGDDGRRLYVGLCAGCHGTDGEGRPHASVPLNTNTTLMLDDPINLVKIIRDGVPARRLANQERLQEMPPFGDRLSDDEMATLVNDLRTRWGGRPGDVTAADVAEIDGR
ncbi:cytochrome c (plasmid) [Tistrella bauzanensis]|uniref:Cytochrome c n=1 Tax=Tistrella arctica TaxID=3133430 RepID=A0ABU9YLA7_9PROT